jgi:hypothetical protein
VAGAFEYGYKLLGYTKFDYLAGYLLLKANAPCSHKTLMTIFSFSLIQVAPVAIIVVTVVAGNSGGGSSSSEVSKSGEQELRTVAIIVVTVVAGNSGGGSSSSEVSKSGEQDLRTECVIQKKRHSIPRTYFYSCYWCCCYYYISY